MDLRTRAARVASCAEIMDVRLVTCTAKSHGAPAADGQLSYDTELNASVDYSDGETMFVVQSQYDVHIKQAPPTDVEAAVNVADVHFTYAALFSITDAKDGEPFSADEMQAFSVTTGQFALHPYARTFVADITGQMGLPPLTLGVMRQSVSEEQRLELEAQKVAD